MPFDYDVKQRAVWKIESFYLNVALKYRHTYSLDDLNRNVHQAYKSIFLIEQSLSRRKPTMKRWEGYHMAHAGKWYYAYTINGDTITIEDACHENNMHDSDDK